MLHLRTFGGLTVERDDGNAATTVGLRRPLALLAMLAAAGPRGVSRDRVAAIFWPESDDEQARNALRQTLFRLRRDVGASDLVVGTTELRLNRATIGSDVGEFEAVLDEGKAERAVALYTGPFLDGVHLPGAGEFERWADAERGRLQRRAQIALETLAADAGRRGDVELAAAWWRRLADLDPLNSHVARHLIAALAEAGDPAGALRHARLHELLLHQEVGVQPPAAVQDLVARLRTPPQTRPSVASPTPDPVHDAPTAPTAPPAGDPAGGAPLSAEASPGPMQIETPVMSRSVRGPTDGQRSWRAPRRPRRAVSVPIVAGIALGVLAALSGLWTARQWRRLRVPRVAESTIAVFPFAVRGGAAEAYLREGLVDLLYARLDGAGEVRGVDPRALMSLTTRGTERGVSEAVDPDRAREVAARLGAGRFVLGEVVDAGPVLEVSASMYDGGGHAVAHAAADGDPTRLTEIADRLAADLLADVYDRPSDRQLHTAALTTASFPALRAYLEGEREFRAGRYAVAADAFRRAVVEDTAFALAYYRLSVADEWAPQTGIQEAAEAAVRHRDRLSERDRLLAEALLARHRGALEEAEQHYRIIVALYPDEMEAWYQLGEIAFHAGPLRGTPLEAARGPFERVLAFQPDDKEALVHLARIAAKTRRLPALDSIIARLASSGDTASASGVRTLRAFIAPDSTGRRRAIAELADVNDEALATAMRHVAVYAEDPAGAQQLARLLSERGRGPNYRVDGYAASALLALARGRWREAQASLGAHEGFAPTWAAPLRAYLAAQPFLPLAPQEIEQERERVLHLDAVQPPHANPVEWFQTGLDRRLRWYAHALLSVRLGDTAAALSDAAELERAGGAPGERALLRTLTATVRAEVARRRGRPAEAMAELDSGRFEAPLGALGTVLGTQAYQRFLRAEILHEIGDDAGALRWYATIAQTSPHELPYLAPSHLAQAEIYERRGDTVRAAAHYRRALDLWRDGDPMFRPLLDEARRRLDAALHRR